MLTQTRIHATYMHIQMHTQTTQAHIHTHVCTHAGMGACLHVHAHTHTHRHTHTHTHALPSPTPQKKKKTHKKTHTATCSCPVDQCPCLWVARDDILCGGKLNGQTPWWPVRKKVDWQDVLPQHICKLHLQQELSQTQVSLQLISTHFPLYPQTHTPPTHPPTNPPIHTHIPSPTPTPQTKPTRNRIYTTVFAI